MRYAVIVAAVAMLALFRGGTANARPAADNNWPFPYILVDFTNDTGLPADGIIVDVYPAVNLHPLRNNPEGCDEPTLGFDPGPSPYGRLYVNWPTACVAPGVTLSFIFGVDCDACGIPSVGSHTWLTFDLTLSPSPSSSPSPSPSPTLSPSPTPSAAATASPTALPTPSPTAAALPKTGGAPSNGGLTAMWVLAGAATMVAGFGLARRSVRR
jgi:hypothetical protein